MHRVELGFHLVAVEEGDRLPVEFDLVGLMRHELAHELGGALEARLALDQDLGDVGVVDVAQRPLDQIAFLVDQRRRRRAHRDLADRIPEARQVFVVALDVDVGALEARGAQDHAHALRHVEVAQDLLHPLAIGRIGDLARNAAATTGVGHQHAVAAGQRQVGGEGGALVAALFLDDLHQQDLPALDDFLDLVLADRVAAAALARLALLDHHLVAAQRLDRDVGLRRLGRIGRFGRGGLAVLLDRRLGCRLVACGSGGCLTAGRIFAHRFRGRSFGGVDMDRAVETLHGDFRGLGLRLGLADRCFLGRNGFGRCRLGGGCFSRDRFRLGGRCSIGGGLAFRGLARCFASKGLFGDDRGLAGFGAGLVDVGTVDPVAAARFVFLGLVVQTMLLGDQPFAIGDGDLVVVGMDFREGQKAVSVAAIFDEGRLERRLYANDLREVDVALEGLAARGFEVEFFKSRSIDHNDPGFFGVSCIDEHTPCHGLAPRRPIPTGASDRRPCRLRRARGAPRHRPVERPTPAKTGKLRAAGPRQGPANLEFPDSHRLPDSLSADRPRPHCVCKGASPAWLGNCRRSATLRRATNDGDCSRTQHTGLQTGRQSKDCVS